MVKDKRPKGENWSFLDAEEMSEWLKDEISDIRRAAELRIKDATDFVTAYAGGISRKKAEDLFFAYTQRWGDVIPGVGYPPEDMSDEQILETLDENRIKRRGRTGRSR